MATEDWIQESLARLESLEEERNRHEAALETADDADTLRMHSQAIERLEAKIRSLYAELEAAAEQGEGEGGSAEDEANDSVDALEVADSPSAQSGTQEAETRLFRREDVAAEAAVVMAAVPVQQAPVQQAPVQQAPVQQAPVQQAPVQQAPVQQAPVQQAASPFGGAAPSSSPFGGAGPASSPFGGAAPTYSSSEGGFSAPASSFSGSGGSFEDDEPRRSGPPWGLIVLLVVVVGGVGGYFALRPKAEVPVTEPAGPMTVIKPIEVPPDTQGPKVVKGSDVDSVKGSQFKEGRPHAGGGHHGGSSTPAPATDKPKKKDPRTKIESTDDPLAGIN